MKAAVYYGPRDIRFEVIPDPVLEKGDVLLRVKACGICGSDLHTYRHGLFEGLGAPLASGGRVMGHEFSAEVVEINGEAPGLKVGDRVCAVGMGGNAEYYRVRAAMLPALFPIPDELGYDEAATVEPLATSFHGVNLAKPVDGETIVVMGAGIIGLGALQLLKATANVKTIVVDLADRRLELATQLGADTVINASREDAVGRIMETTGSTELSLVPGVLAGTVDAAIDCAGVTKNFTGTTVVEQAISVVKQEGRVVVVAVFERPIELEMNMLMRKGIKLFGSWAWYPDELRAGMELMRQGKVDRKPLISHTFSLEDAAEAFETQDKADDSIKVLIKP
jgi:2-desacetyl-2-hydroxyethyl bacteriochlorophyllide A dehydrogenase